jgi:hypothetical protein
MEEQQPLQIICLQTYLTQYHYRSYPILKEHLRKCIQQKRVRYPAVVILPECIGIWFYLMCVPMSEFLRNYFFNDHHLFFIIYTLITHIWLFFKQIYKNYHSKTTWLGLIQRSWFTLFAEETCLVYKKLFSELACETNCTIVAGSIFMYDDVDQRDLYNMSCVFEPNNGSICLQSGKQYPVADEIHFINSYKKKPLIYSIPNTNVDIGVLICADSWMPQVYEEYNQIIFNSQRRFLFIIVALNTDQWNIPWPGYDTHCDVPKDVEEKHLKSFSLSEAWLHYAVNRGFEVLSKRNDLIGYGVVCCQGVLNIMNDIQAQGESVILIKRSQTEAKLLFEAKTCSDERILTCEF